MSGRRARLPAHWDSDYVLRRDSPDLLRDRVALPARGDLHLFHLLTNMVMMPRLSEAARSPGFSPQTSECSSASGCPEPAVSAHPWETSFLGWGDPCVQVTSKVALEPRDRGLLPFPGVKHRRQLLASTWRSPRVTPHRSTAMLLSPPAPPCLLLLRQ